MNMQVTQIFWILFFVLILGAVIYDLWIQGRRKKELSTKDAGLWTLGWIYHTRGVFYLKNFV